MKLLIIEDEEDLLRVLEKYFVKKGYVVETAADGLEGLHMYEINAYDLIILDLNLPTMDGIEVLANIRRKDQLQRVLILSARAELEDRILGFDMGTNDYIPKPFSIAELDARVRALLRCEIKQQNPEIVCGVFTLNTDAKKVFVRDTLLELAPKEYAIMEYLLLHNGKVISAETLIEHIWDSEVNLFTESVKVHISNIRRKLRTLGVENGIATVKGHGYIISEEEMNR